MRKFDVLYNIARNNYCKDGMSPGGIAFTPDDLKEVVDFVMDGYTFEDAFSRVIKELDEIMDREFFESIPKEWFEGEGA